MARVRLKRGHVQPVWAGHPWVYAQAIAEVEGAPAPGDSVSVIDPKGRFLGRGFWSPKSAIPVRLLTRDPDIELALPLLRARLEEAVSHRGTLDLPSAETTGYRLVHAEGDRLPGLIVDLYGDVAVVQFLTTGMKRREDLIFGELSRVTGARSILEVPAGSPAREEGLAESPQVVRGPSITHLEFRERGFEFRVDPSSGQKTGFFFDQRPTRGVVERLAKGRRVLDVCSYVGAFSLAAARGSAEEVLGIDRSAAAVAAAAQHANSANLASRIHFLREDARRALPALARDQRQFDLVVVDPPKLVSTTRHLAAGRRAYRKMNQQAIQLLAPGGWLVTCSCSAAMKPDDFTRTVAMAGADAGREVLVTLLETQGPDHPTPAGFPEGRYLKVLIARVPR